MRYRRSHFVEAKHAEGAEGARTVKIENPQIVSFGQARGHNVEMRAVPVLGERYRNLIGEKFPGSFGSQLLSSAAFAEFS